MSQLTGGIKSLAPFVWRSSDADGVNVQPIKKQGPSKSDKQTIPPPFERLDPDPVRQFKRGLGDAKQVGIDQLYAMTLATTSGDNIPSARWQIRISFFVCVPLKSGWASDWCRLFPGESAQPGSLLLE